MKISLVFPPQWTAAQPYAGVLQLNAELRRAGHQVSCLDLNLEMLEYVVSPEILHLSSRRLDSEVRALKGEVKLRLGLDDTSDRLATAGKKLMMLEHYADQMKGRWDQLVHLAPRALDAMRDRRLFYDPDALIASMSVLDEALKAYSRPFFPSDLRWNDFANPACRWDLQPILAFADERVHNPFRAFYEDRLAQILAGDPDLIALSIGSFSQVLPGLTLARMLKTEIDRRRRAGTPAPHLSLGGNFFTRLVPALEKTPDVFRVFTDTLIAGEGEVPLVALARELGSEGDLSRVPGLLWLVPESDTVRVSPNTGSRKMIEAAYPDPSGFPVSRYLSADRVLCIAASKGCYYGECAFCDSHYGLGSDELPIRELIEQIRWLRDEHGVRHFELIDQCIAPAYMNAMCDALIAADLDVRWFCNARTEPGFTPELLRKMKAAGATMVMWGVESASPRLLKLMRKGVSTSERMNILKASADADLWNFAYVFFGFPTETFEEAMATIDLLRNNTGVIHSYGRSVFTLGKHSPLFEDKESFGILEYVEDDQELSTNLSYRTSSGLQAEDLGRVSALCTKLCAEAWGDPLWMALRSRENLHLYLAEHGREYVRDHRLARGRDTSRRPVAAEFIF